MAFLAWFSFTLLLFLLFGAFTLTTAQKGISMLEDKKARYDEIFRNMNSLTTKERTGNEHRQLQLLITQERDKMIEEIGTSDADSSNYALYKSILEQVRTTQETIDRYNSEARKREYNLGQLQKGRHKLR